MGGSRPSAPVTYVPQAATPSLFVSEVPKADFARATDLTSRTEQMRQDLIQKRFAEVGTPEEIGARQRGIEAREAASYLTSLPKGDTTLEQTTGLKDPYKPIRETVEGQLTDAQKAYAEAMQKVGRKTTTTAVTETPSWAQRTVT